MDLSSKKIPFLEWIHCNTCYDLYVYKTRIFYLLAGCLHIVCAKCIREKKPEDSNGPSHYKCSVCLKLARACQVNNNMPKHLKDLFHPFPNKEDLNMSVVLQFQQRHQQRFRHYIQRMTSFLDERQENLSKRRDGAKTLYQQLREARSERKQLEQRMTLVKKRHREMEERKKNPRPLVHSTYTTSESSKFSAHPNKPRINRSILYKRSQQISANLSGPRMPQNSFNSNAQNNPNPIANFAQNTESFVL
uniref:RING-type domain-containing protein n=1 Tax=Glossina brevipalpis TaxID=37001 RepID=A0A1A9WIJ0_9MUSC